MGSSRVDAADLTLDPPGFSGDLPSLNWTPQIARMRKDVRHEYVSGRHMSATA